LNCCLPSDKLPLEFYQRMAQTMNLSTQRNALSGSSLGRMARVQRPFVARSRPVAAAPQGPSDFLMKTVGALAAAQIALLPAVGPAVAANPLAPNPLDFLEAKTKNAANDAKAIANSAGQPDPVKDLQQKTKAAANRAANPAQEYARRAEKEANKAKGTVKRGLATVNKAVENPAREFARKSEEARKAAQKKLPLGSIGFGNLQQNVLFGFGENKADKAADQAAGNVKEAASDAKGAAKDVAEEADKATPDSFSIFDADSVSDLRSKLKANVNEAVKTKEDPAERVVSVGKPGETQEDNAERIRQEAENGPVAGGDARGDDPTPN